MTKPLKIVAGSGLVAPTLVGALAMSTAARTGQATRANDKASFV